MTDPTPVPIVEPVLDVPDTAVADELIVHLPHKDLVVNALRDQLGIYVDGTPDVDARLDLVRMKLDGITDVNPVLTRLRIHFADRYDQWTPLMDSNRHVGTVIGLPQPQSMTLDIDPEKADPPDPAPFTPTGRGIRVGVLDTRIYAHPDLVGSIVAAAGNHANNYDISVRKAPTWPAGLPDVVAVGARDVDDTPAPFSPLLPWVTCTAPGVALTGAYLRAVVHTVNSGDEEFHGHARWSGTSFAAAMASGAIAAATSKGTDPRAALERLMAEPNGVVRRYTQCDDMARA